MLFANGFFVASEFALVSVRQTRMLQLANEGNNTAQLAVNALKELDKYIAAVQLGITISSIGIGWVGEAALAKILQPMFDFLPFVSKTIATHTLAIAIAFSIITFLHVVIGELMPKSIALQYPEKTTLFVARPMAVITKIFTPFIFLLNGLGNFLLKLMKIPPAHPSTSVHSEEELNMIIDASYNGGILNETEKDILQNVFKFSDLTAKQVMIPRTDIVAVPSDISTCDLENLVNEYQYTRYPVYENDLDHITGILHVKDLYSCSMKNEEYNISSLLRPPMLIPETIKMENLIKDFKSQKNQMAVVIDEFGGTAGIITLEDVLEEIFGEVQDEFDEEEADIKQICENEFIANAKMRIDELANYFEVEIIEEDVDTIAGLVVKSLGKIAELNDTIMYGTLEFKVIEIDGARITKLKIIKQNSDKKEDL